MAKRYRTFSIGRSPTPLDENCQRLPGYRKKGRIRISRGSANLTLEGSHSRRIRKGLKSYTAVRPYGLMDTAIYIRININSRTMS